MEVTYKFLPNCILHKSPIFNFLCLLNLNSSKPNLVNDLPNIPKPSTDLY